MKKKINYEKGSKKLKDAFFKYKKEVTHREIRSVMDFAAGYNAASEEFKKQKKL